MFALARCQAAPALSATTGLSTQAEVTFNRTRWINPSRATCGSLLANSFARVVLGRNVRSPRGSPATGRASLSPGDRGTAAAYQARQWHGTSAFFPTLSAAGRLRTMQADALCAPCDLAAVFPRPHMSRPLSPSRAELLRQNSSSSEIIRDGGSDRDVLTRLR